MCSLKLNEGKSGYFCEIVINNLTTEEEIRQDAKRFDASPLNLSQFYRFGMEIKKDCSQDDLYSCQSVSKETRRSMNTGKVRMSFCTIKPH